MGSFKKHNVWTFVPRNNTIPLKSCWILATKIAEKGPIRKARFVICGSNQTEGMDYYLTFAPTLGKEALRLLIAIVGMLGFELHQLDVQAAFLHGDIDHEIFVELPPITTPKDILQTNIARLNQSVYGLKQSPLLWNTFFSNKVCSRGFLRSQHEPSIFHRRFDNSIQLISVYVDDIFVAAKQTSVILEIKSMLCEFFDMTDMGVARNIFGWEISYNPENITLTQKQYTNEILKRFGFDECTPAYLPILSGA
jgi:Reverse transcriptase (RNA-dependent DNA polymerase)